MTRIVHAVVSAGFAGVERFITSLAREQARIGHEVLVCGGPAAPMAAQLEGSEVHYRPAAGVAGMALVLARAAGDADVVNVHMTAAELAAVVAGGTVRVRRRRRPPIVATRHFALVRAVGSGPAGPALARVLTPRIAAQIAVSRTVAAAVDGPATVVHPGVPDNAAVIAPEARERVVLVVQRLEREKHTDEAIRAFAGSRLAARGWQLHVIGVGAQEASLRRLAAGSGAGEAIRFLGFRSDVPQLMARAGVLLAPNPGEHLGLSVLEAMAAGLPVVAAGAAGHLETLGLVPAARLHPPGDVGAAGALLAALADDASGRAAYAQAARRVHREHFSLGRQVAQTDAVYAVAMAARG